MKNNPLAESSVWRDCLPGELVELGAQQRRRQQRRAVLQGLGLAAAGCAAAGALSTLWFQPRQPQKQPFAPGGLVCDEVTRLLPAYVAHQLDARKTAQVEKHLASCGHCSERLKQLQSASVS